MPKKQQIAIATVGDVVQIMDTADLATTTAAFETEALTKWITMIKRAFEPMPDYDFEITVLLTTAEPKDKISASSGSRFLQFVSNNVLIAPDFYWLLKRRLPLSNHTI